MPTRAQLENERDKKVKQTDDLTIVALFAGVVKIARKPYRTKEDLAKLSAIENRFDWTINGAD